MDINNIFIPFIFKIQYYITNNQSKVEKQIFLLINNFESMRQQLNQQNVSELNDLKTKIDNFIEKQIETNNSSKEKTDELILIQRAINHTNCSKIKN